MNLKNSLIIFCSISISTLAFAHKDDRFAEVEYEVTDLGHGIYMLVAAGGNIGLSVGEDGAFMIDDQFAPLSEKLMATVAKITDEQVKYVLNTHWHGDHVGGNENLAKKGSTIVAHENVRMRMAASGDNQSPEEALPVITFSEDITFYLNGETVAVSHPSNAHTDGDAYIHFKEANIIHAGDILFNNLYPFIDLDSGGSVDGYLKGLKALISLSNEETQIIPGHGSLATKADLEKTVTMIETTRILVKKWVDAGKSLEEVLEMDPLKDYHENWSWAFIDGKRFTATLYNDLAN